MTTSSSAAGGVGAGSATFLSQQTHHQALFEDYIAAFNTGNLDAVATYLHPDVFFDRGEWPPLTRRESFVAFYRDLWAHADEHLVLGATVWDGATLHARLHVSLNVHHDLPDFVGGALRAGDRLESLPNHLRYWFRDDQIVKIVDLEL